MWFLFILMQPCQKSCQAAFTSSSSIFADTTPHERVWSRQRKWEKLPSWREKKKKEWCGDAICLKPTREDRRQLARETLRKDGWGTGGKNTCPSILMYDDMQMWWKSTINKNEKKKKISIWSCLPGCHQPSETSTSGRTEEAREGSLTDAEPAPSAPSVQPIEAAAGEQPIPDTLYVFRMSSKVQRHSHFFTAILYLRLLPSVVPQAVVLPSVFKGSQAPTETQRLLRNLDFPMWDKLPQVTLEDLDLTCQRPSTVSTLFFFFFLKYVYWDGIQWTVLMCCWFFHFPLLLAFSSRWWSRTTRTWKPSAIGASYWSTPSFATGGTARTRAGPRGSSGAIRAAKAGSRTTSSWPSGPRERSAATRRRRRRRRCCTWRWSPPRRERGRSSCSRPMSSSSRWRGKNATTSSGCTTQGTLRTCACVAFGTWRSIFTPRNWKSFSSCEGGAGDPSYFAFERLLLLHWFQLQTLTFMYLMSYFSNTDNCSWETTFFFLFRNVAGFFMYNFMRRHWGTLLF